MTPNPITPPPPPRAGRYMSAEDAAAYLRTLADHVQRLTCKVRIDLTVDYATDAELAQRALDAQKRGCRRGKKP